jgi:O-antigen/teichoic acid export membrane protein
MRKGFLKELASLPILKTSFLSSIATFIKIISLLVINKTISAFIGPSGLAFIGNFHSFSQLITLLAQSGINAGVTKYIAEYHDDETILTRLISTSLKISIFSSFLCGSILLIFSNVASFKILNSTSYTFIFVIFAFTLIFSVINNLLISIINGFKDIKAFVAINISQSLFNLIFTCVLIYFFGLRGALIALVTNQSIIFLLALWVLKRNKFIKIKYFLAPFSLEETKKLLMYSLMALTSAICFPISQLLVRTYIGETISWESAGYWQGMIYISSLYLMLITTTLSVYYLPKLSELKDKLLIKREIIQGFYILLPIMIFTSLTIFFLKDFISLYLFSKEFLPMTELFLWHLIGDVFKILAWLLTFIMLAKALTFTYILSEIIFTSFLVLSSIYFVDIYGIVGSTYAYALTYFVYFLFGIFLFKRFINAKQ